MKNRIYLLSWAALGTALLAPDSLRAATDQAHSPSPGIDARMMRYPDVSATQIAFVYPGDIWVAPKAGGVAERLSSPKGEESFPRFSPDGTQLAFTGDYDGDIDISVLPAADRLPPRLLL